MYDEELADRIRGAISAHEQRPGELSERKMFGGLGFMLRGHLAVAAAGNGGMLVRCDPAQTPTHLADGAAPMQMRGRVMNGWLAVSSESLSTDEAIDHWVGVGASYCAGLAPK